MKFKKAILITLLLFAVLTLSAVSATEDVAADNITSSDESQDVIEQSDDIASNQDEIAKTNDEEIVGEGNNGSNEDNYDDGEPEDDGPLYEVTTGMFAPSVQVKSKSNQNFQVYAYNFDGDTMEGLSNYKLIIKVWTGKTAKKYTIKTDKYGVAKFNTKKLSAGTHKVKILCPAGKYPKSTAVSKIVVKKKIPVHALKIKITNSNYEVSKSLKYGDQLKSKVSTSKKTVEISTENDKGAHFKIQKVKFFFKNKKTGKIKAIKVYKSKFDPYDCFATTKLIKGYTPYKAKVWVYKYRTHKDAFRW